MKKNTGIKRIIKATGYSLNGLKYVFINETAFRQELLLCAILSPIVFILDINSTNRALMLGSLFLVLIIEVLNTAFEQVVERISPEINPISKIIKDLGSAAVFLALLNAVVIWVIGFIG